MFCYASTSEAAFVVATVDSNSFSACKEIFSLTQRPLVEVCLNKQETVLSHSWRFYVLMRK